MALIAIPFAAAAEPAMEWNFAVQLDGKAIGTHRFALVPADVESRQLTSDARFDVKLLGFTVYRYRHHAEETWRGNCLAAITASTDDDGHLTDVTGATADAGFTVSSRRKGAASVPVVATGCVMSFAYWNRTLAAQRQLLDPGTGRIEAVTITELPTGTIDVHGQHMTVSGIRITGLPHPIDVWYANERWVGLDTTVDGGRRLSYRLP